MARKVPASTMSPASAKLKSYYEQLVREGARLFPKVDQKLLLTMLHYEHAYNDWEGSVLVEIVYPRNVDIDSKKEWIFKSYGRVPSAERDRTLRFKAIRMYVKDLERLLSEDPEIEYITGSATLAPTDGYTI